MRAIDFACRLLSRLESDKMPSIKKYILFALGAGLETSRDIAQQMGLRQAQVSAQLNALEQLDYVERVGATSPKEYQLTARGRGWLAGVFDFKETRGVVLH